MGKATVDTNLTEAQYQITLITDTRRLDQRKTDLTAKIADADFNQQITDAQTALTAAKAALVTAQDDLDDVMDGWSSVGAWSSGTDYVVGTEVLASGVFAAAKCVQAGRSGSSEPLWGSTQGEIIKENYVTWNTFFSAVSLGHPAWSATTNYTSGDDIFCTTVPGGSLYATAGTTGRSGFSEPPWRVDLDAEGNSIYPDFDDGGVWWRRQNSAETILERAKLVIDAQAEVGKAQLEVDRLLARKLSMQKELDYLNAYTPAAVQQNVWCADFVDDIATSTEVISSEVNGDRKDGLLIRAKKPPHNGMLTLHNDYRKAVGLRELLPDYRLYAAAQRHADDMASIEVRDDFQHDGTDGSGFDDRANDAGFPVYKDDGSTYPGVTLAENLTGSNFSTDRYPDNPFDRWLASPGHLTNIENPHWSFIGIGYTNNLDSNPQSALPVVWVCVFASHNIQSLPSGYDYDKGTAGIHQPTIAGTAASTFWNLAMLPGWQKWTPTYRVGELTAIDRDNNTGTVALDEALTPTGDLLLGLQKHNLDINQPDYDPSLTATFRYMCCDSRAFCVGDRVLVEFAGQSWEHPYIVGFKSNPRPCAIRIKITRGDGYVTADDDDFWMDLSLYDEDENYVGGGGWNGPDVDPAPTPPRSVGIRGQVSYDSASNYWTVWVEDTGNRCDTALYLEIDGLNMIPSGTQYPQAYKSADKFQANKIEDRCEEPFEMTVPYWRTETVSETRVVDVFDASYVQAGIKVWSSVPYKINHSYLNTNLFYEEINPISNFKRGFVLEWPDGRITVIADGEYATGDIIAQSPIASPPTNTESLAEGTIQRGEFSATVDFLNLSYKEHTTKILHHENLRQYDGTPGDPLKYDPGAKWFSSAILNATHTILVPDDTYWVQAFAGAVYDY